MVSLTVRQTGTAVANSVYVGTTQAPIQEAINYAVAQGGGSVFIEKGTYDIQVPINVGSNIKVHGEDFKPHKKIYGKFIYSILKMFRKTLRYFSKKANKSTHISPKNVMPKLVPSFANADTNAVFRCVGTVGNELTNINIENLYIGSNNSNVVGKYGVYGSYVGTANNQYGVCIINCVFMRNNDVAIYFENSYQCITTGLIIIGNGSNSLCFK